MNPSGSGLEQASRCAASRALSRAGTTGVAAIVGTSNHDTIETGLVVGGDLSALPEVVQKAMEGATWVEVEMAFALDVETEKVRLLGRRLNRNYGELGPHEIPMTVDAVIARPGEVTVWDWKSRKRVTAAKTNLQIRAGSVAVALWMGAKEVTGAIGYLDNGEIDHTEVDAFDAAALFSDMRAMLKRIDAAKAIVAEGGTPEVFAGPWCDYCPSMPYCPAHARLAMTMIGELDYMSKEIAFFTPEQVSKAWDTYKRLESMLENAGASLRMRIQQSVIPRPGNKRLAMVEMPGRSSFDADRAKAKLREIGEDIKAYTKKGSPYFQVKEINLAPHMVPTDHE